MATQQATALDRTRSTIRITCTSSGARKIILTGCFNDWNPEALPMTKASDGQWSVDLNLPPGRYEYKFVVDGISCCEPHLKNGHRDGEQCAPDGFGELNRILLVR